MGVCFIVGAGDFCEKSLDVKKGDIVIAADGGYKYLEAIGIKPDIYMGDFDSAPKPETDTDIEVFKCEKDDTDTILAVKHALGLGFKDFKIFGGCGGREDHTFANIQTLSYIVSNGGKAKLFGKNEVYTVIDSFISFEKEMTGKISVFSLSDISEGVSIKGLKYGLENGELTNRFPLGVSNEFCGKPSEITVKSGLLLIIYGRN